MDTGQDVQRDVYSMNFKNRLNVLHIMCAPMDTGILTEITSKHMQMNAAPSEWRTRRLFLVPFRSSTIHVFLHILFVKNNNKKTQN